MIPYEEIRKDLDRSWTFKLLNMIENKAQDEDFSDVCTTLARLDDPRSVKPLIELLENTELPLHIRITAGDVMHRMCIGIDSQKRREWWNSGDKQLMLQSMMEARASEADILVPIANDPSHLFYPAAIAGMTAGFEEPEYQKLKVHALSHESPRVRIQAARALDNDMPLIAEEPLIKALSDSDDDVSAEALETLYYCDTKRVLLAFHELGVAGPQHRRAAFVEAFNDMRDRFVRGLEWLKGDRGAYLFNWLKQMDDLIPLDRPKKRERPHRPMREKEPAEVLSRQEVIEFFDEVDGLWTKKFRRDIDWEAFSSRDRKYLAEYFRNHQDHAVRDIACQPLSTWDRGDVLVSFLKDACCGVRASAAMYLEDVTKSQEIAESLLSLFCDPSVYGSLADYALSSYVVHDESDGLEDRLMNIVSEEPKPSKKAAAILELKGLNAHSHLRMLLQMLADPPIVDWQLHISLVDYCEVNELPIPNFSELCEIDNLDVQYALSSAVPRCHPILLKGLSYAVTV